LCPDQQNHENQQKELGINKEEKAAAVH